MPTGDRACPLHRDRDVDIERLTDSAEGRRDWIVVLPVGFEKAASYILCDLHGLLNRPALRDKSAELIRGGYVATVLNLLKVQSEHILIRHVANVYRNGRAIEACVSNDSFCCFFAVWITPGFPETQPHERIV